MFRGPIASESRPLRAGTPGAQPDDGRGPAAVERPVAGIGQLDPGAAVRPALHRKIGKRDYDGNFLPRSVAAAASASGAS